MSWVLLWCLTFKYLQSIEKKYRLYELITILNRLFKVANYDKNRTRFLENVLNTILEHGKFEHMEILFDALVELNVSITIKMKQFFSKAHDKHQAMMNSKQVKNNSFSKNKHDIKNNISKFARKQRDLKFIATLKKSGRLRKRSFKSYAERKNLLIEEVIFFDIPGKCNSCGKISDFEQIFEYIDDSGSFKCFFCGEFQFPSLNVCIGNKNDSYHIKTSITTECTLSSESEILSNIKQLYDNSVNQNSQKFDLMILREHRESILWN